MFSFVRSPACRRPRSSLTLSYAHTIKNVITSPKSNTLQKVQKLLQQRKKRLEYNQVVVEGPRSVLDLLQTHQHVVRQVIVDVDQPHYHTALSQFDVEIHYATAAALRSCSDTNQGIVAVCDIPESGVATTTQQQQQCVTLILDALQDPGNVGTLIRSAAATGVVQDIYFLPGTCDPWNPKALRSAMGTTFGVSMKFVDSWSACVRELRREDKEMSIYAAAMTDESKCYHDLIQEWSEQSNEKNMKQMALILGSEGNGLSREIQDALQAGEIQAMHIPMQPVVESLNAAVCGSILLYEVLRSLSKRNR